MIILLGEKSKACVENGALRFVRKDFPPAVGYDRMGAEEVILMKKLMMILLAALLLTACAQEEQETVYVNITAEEAKKIMDSETGYVILDVRTPSEFDQGHIPGAILIPDTEIKARAESVLTDQDQLILVYCRSGRRSKLAAEALVELGYTNIKEFGGILDWPYEIE